MIIITAEIIRIGAAAVFDDPAHEDPVYIEKELAVLGVTLTHQTAADTSVRLKRAMIKALERSDVIITLGGLGDYAKEIVCDGLGIPLIVHNESLALLKAYYEQLGREMPTPALKQVIVPEGAAVFPNEYGTAPGCAISAGKQCIVMLPDSNTELLPMLVNHAYAYIAQFSGVTTVTRTASTFGLSMSQIKTALSDIMSQNNPTVSLYPKPGQIVVRITAKASTKEQAAGICSPFLRTVIERLGENVYGIDVLSLQQVIVQQLRIKGLKIATAESCTGGLLSQKITEVPGASTVFEYGISAYADKVKSNALGVPESMISSFGAISEQVAVAMADGARREGGASIGVGITGNAGPNPAENKPVGLVYIAMCDRQYAWAIRLTLGENSDRERVRQLSALAAMNLVRLYLDHYPNKYKGAIPLGQALAGNITAINATSSKKNAPNDDPPREKYVADAAEPKAETSGKKSHKLSLLLIIAALLILLGASAFIFNHYYTAYKNNENTILLKPPPDGTPDYLSHAKGILPPEFILLYNINRHLSDLIFAQSSLADAAYALNEPGESALTYIYNRPDATVDPEAPDEPDIPAYLQTPGSSSTPPSSSSTPPSSSSTPPSSSSTPINSSPPIDTTPPGSSIDPVISNNINNSEEEVEEDWDKWWQEYLDRKGAGYNNDYYESQSGNQNNQQDNSWDDGSWNNSYHMDRITVYDQVSGTNVTGNTYDIVARIVQHEVGGSFHAEAIKAQAVAAYTYVIYYSVILGQTPNVGLSAASKVTQEVKNAVNAVNGRIITFDGQPILASYFSTSAGRTNSSQEVWGGNYAYLQSVDSSVDYDAPGFERSFTMSAYNVADRVRRTMNIDLYAYSSNPDDWFEVLSYTEGGYNASMRVGGQTRCQLTGNLITGRYIRENVIGMGTMRSAAFDVYYDWGSDNLIFTTRGYGHGVGMSQYGAQLYALMGWSYTQILQHYYTGARVQ